MKKLNIIILTTLIFLPEISLAQIYINEIMYDLSGSDTSREWVEIYNAGSSSVDVSTMKFLETPSASNHSISQVQGVSNIPAGGYAVISIDPTKFLLDWPSFSGNLFKSSFSSLNNTSGTVVLKDKDLVVLDQTSYTSSQGAAGDGNSLQKTSSSWISATPTPGAINTIESTTPATTDSAPESTTTPTTTTTTEKIVYVYSAHSSPAPLNDTDQKIEFEISAGRNRLTTVGNNIEFIAVPTKLKNLIEQSITYEWSFGDGTTGQGKTVSHTYKFPGEYSVVVNATASDQKSVSRLSVKVIFPEIYLNKIEGGVELWNKSSSEINIEGWNLVGETKTFTFPKDTLVSANKKIIFADEITGIGGGQIKVTNPSGKVFGSLGVVSTSSNITQKDPYLAVNLNEIQSKINDVKNKITQITQTKGIISDKNVISITPVIKKTIQTKKIEDNPIVEEDSNNNQKATAIEAFEAPKKDGIVSKVFAWPIKGFDFIRRLFVEE